MRGADVVVVSSAVRPDNPEVLAAQRASIPVIPRAEMLAAEDKTSQAYAEFEALPLADGVKRKWLHDNAARFLRLD